MRDATLEDVLYFMFTTRAFATGVPTTLSGSPVLSVLESNNATPITAGVSVSVDRASVTGLNQATVVATAANGYEAGKSYAVYISTGTVGGTSAVGEVVAEFTVNASAAFTRLGAPAGASHAADIAAIKVDTAAILVDTGTTLDGAIAAVKVDTAAILVDTGTTLDAAIAAILVDTGTDIPATLATIAGYLDTEIAAIKAKTDNLPTDPADQSAVEAAILAAWTTALTEAYRANGATGTPAQLLYEIAAHLGESAIAGTTKTIKKVDHSTTAATFTLDDATNPTSITRAT